MAITSIRIKRHLDGASGPPTTLASGELAYDEVGGVLYYGKGLAADGRSATTVVVIGGENLGTIPVTTGLIEFVLGGQQPLLGGQIMDV